MSRTPASPDEQALSARALRLIDRRLATLDRRLRHTTEPIDQVLVVMNSVRAVLRHVSTQLAADVAADLVEAAYAAYRQLLIARCTPTEKSA